MARRSPADKLESQIDRLYRLPLAEFTPARDALARKLKDAGDAQGARRIKGLPKPVLSAWVVNQLWWGARKPFERLIETGQLPLADEQRRKARDAMIARAEKVMEDAGQTSTRMVLRRIERNLETIATLEGAGQKQQPGRLSRDLDPPGFDTLLALGAGKPSRKRAAAKKKEKATANQRAIDAARAALERAERQHGRRRVESDEAQALHEKARQRALDVREQINLARSRLRLAEEHGKRAATELKRADTKRQRAAEALATADGAVRKARQELKSVRRR